MTHNTHITQVKDTIKVLQNQIDEEQNALNNKIEALNALRKLLPNQDNINSGYELTAEVQILSLFENKIIRYAVKRSEIQEIFEKEYNTQKNVGAGLPKLKRTGKLKMVRYNGQKGYSYWALPSWIEGNNLKEEFKPSPQLLPQRIIKSEII